jgi:hypothetical protein
LSCDCVEYRDSIAYCTAWNTCIGIPHHAVTLAPSKLTSSQDTYSTSHSRVPCHGFPKSDRRSTESSGLIDSGSFHIDSNHPITCSNATASRRVCSTAMSLRTGTVRSVQGRDEPDKKLWQLRRDVPPMPYLRLLRRGFQHKRSLPYVVRRLSCVIYYCRLPRHPARPHQSPRLAIRDF